MSLYSAAAGAPLRQEARRPIRVLVVDTRRLIADAIASLIERTETFQVLAAVSSDQALEAVTRHSPDVVVYGAGGDSEEALAPLRALRAAAPDLEVIIVADTLDPDLVRFVLDEQIGGMILSDTPAHDIERCIEQLSHGHAVLPSGWQRALASVSPNPIDALSKRQLEVLRLLAEGCSYEQIATRLFISVNTVKFHTRSIFSRLGVRNRMAAVRLLGKQT